MKLTGFILVYLSKSLSLSQINEALFLSVDFKNESPSPVPSVYAGFVTSASKRSNTFVSEPIRIYLWTGAELIDIGFSQ